MAWRIGERGIPPTYKTTELPAEVIANVEEGWERDGELFAHQPWKTGDGTPTFQRWRRLTSKGTPDKGYCGKVGA